MSKQKTNKALKVLGVDVTVKENDYISLTDIAKSQSEKQPFVLINSWLQNQKTLIFLEEWELLHNDNFKPHYMVRFRTKAADVRANITPKMFIEETDAIGLISKQGRGGGVFAHKDLAIAFCYWLNPKFQIYLVKEFERLKSIEQAEQMQNWTIEKLLRNSSENIILLQSLKELRAGKELPSEE